MTPKPRIVLVGVIRRSVRLRLAGAFAKFQTAPLHPRHIINLSLAKRIAHERP
jgi:hypothetical protein